MRIRRVTIALFGTLVLALPFAISYACTCGGEPLPLFLIETGALLPANTRGILSPYPNAHWERVPIDRVDKQESPVPFKVEKIPYPENLRKGRGGSMTFALLCPEWEPGGVYRIGTGPRAIEVTISTEDFVPDTSQIDIWEDEIGKVTAGGGTACSMTLDAHRVGIEMSGREVEKWGAALLYFTVVDGTERWQPTRSMCADRTIGRSWVGPTRDLLYSSCSSGSGLFENLTRRKHVVTMVAWLPGVGLTSATREIEFRCK